MAGRAPMLWIWYWVTAAMVQPSWTTGTTARSARSAATRLPHRVQPARRGAECEYLRELAIATADKILFVADGARWIWNRVGALLRRLGIKPEQVDELVDFYHAVEHLGKIAAVQGRWTGPERQTWIRRQRRRLLKGKIVEVQTAIEALCGPRSSKALKRERAYFKRNGEKGRMD